MQSERMERLLRFSYHESQEEKDNADKEFRTRIRMFLNHPDLNEYSLVDAYYYDYSVLPEPFQDKFCRDMYLLYGITEKGEMITKWVERHDLDSDKPIEDCKRFTNVKK